MIVLSVVALMMTAVSATLINNSDNDNSDDAAAFNHESFWLWGELTLLSALTHNPRVNSAYVKNDTLQKHFNASEEDSAKRANTNDVNIIIFKAYIKKYFVLLLRIW